MVTVRLLSALVFVLLLSTSCTRSVENSTIKIKLPKATTSPDQKAKNLKAKASILSGVATDELPPWNFALIPTSIEEVNCYAVFVGGPDLDQNTCSSSDGSFEVKFGAESFSGFFPAGSEVTLEVPSGEARVVHLAGAVAQAGACATGVIENDIEPDFENLSLPQIISTSNSLDLNGGVTTVTMQANLNPSKFFDSCDFIDFDDGGGDDGEDETDPIVDPGKPILFLKTSVTDDVTTPAEFSPASPFDFAWTTPGDTLEHFVVLNDTISVLNTGDYFTAWNYSVSTTSQRPVQQIDFLVDGGQFSTLSTNGNYIRNSSGHSEGSLNLAGLANFSLGQQLRLSVVEFYNFAGGSTTGTTSLYLEPVDSSRKVFAATATDLVSGTNLNPGTQSPIEWVEKRTDAAFTHSDATNPEQITINESGRYMFSFNAPITSSVQRGTPIMQVAVNSTGINAFTAANCYIRANASDTECLLSGSGFFNAASGDVVTFELFQGAVAGVANIQSGKEMTVFLEKTSDDGTFFGEGSATTIGANWNEASAASVLWTTTPHVDTSVYSHSTSSNQEEITVNQSGDYLVQFNAGVTSAGQRVNLRVSLFVNGIEQPGSQVTSFYIRATSGHDDSSGSLFYFLEGLAAGDIIEVKTIQESAAGTVTAVGNAQLSITKK